MTGDVEIGGVYVPGLLVLGAIALVLTAAVSRLLAIAGLYRFVAYRPIVDVALFVLILGGLVVATAPAGGRA